LTTDDTDTTDKFSFFIRAIREIRGQKSLKETAAGGVIRQALVSGFMLWACQ